MIACQSSSGVVVLLMIVLLMIVLPMVVLLVVVLLMTVSFVIVLLVAVRVCSPFMGPCIPMITNVRAPWITGASSGQQTNALVELVDVCVVTRQQWQTHAGAFLHLVSASTPTEGAHGGVSYV